MSESTYYVISEDLHKMESRESKLHGGITPKESEVSALKSLIAEREEPKPVKVDRVKAHLPLPEDPPGSPDWNSADARPVNVGSGGVSDDVSVNKGSSSGLREPATADSSVRTDGEEWKTNTAP